MNLELKRTPQPAALVAGVVRCLRQARRIRAVLVSSFDAGLLRRLRAQAPQVATALLCYKAPARAIARAGQLGCVAIHPHQRVASPTLIRRAHAAGLRVHVWTVDQPRRAARLVCLGVDGLFTNAPDRLRQVVR